MISSNAVPNKPNADNCFDDIVKGVEDICGFSLNHNRRELFRNRLLARAESLGLPGLGAYWQKIHDLPHTNVEWQFIVNQATINKTGFFREPLHFQYLTEKILPEWKQSGRTEFRVWSAGCSTGEEPYTIAMVLEEHLGGNYRVLASDVDQACLDRAKKAVYARARLTEVPAEYQKKYFAFGTGDIAEWVKIKDSVKRHIEFHHHNLINLPYPWSEPFDLVFCRNVLLYFVGKALTTALRGLQSCARPGGHLFVGHSESLLGVETEWVFEQPAVYVIGAFQKPADPKPAELTSAVRPAPERVSVPRPGLPAPVSPASVSPTLVPTVTLPRPSPVPERTAPAARSSAGRTRVLVVEDSKTVRNLIVRILSSDPNLEVVGTASNPIEAEPLIDTLRPNVVTMDVMMPVMDGITFLKKYLPKKPIPIVMISSLGVEQGPQVLQALENGAVDYIQKPLLSDFLRLAPAICERVRTAASSKVRLRNGEGRAPSPTIQLGKGISLDTTKVLAVGASTGGTEALREVLTQMPYEIPPILIVQHLPSQFSKAFAQRLNEVCPFQVIEAQGDEKVEPRKVILAPGDRHMALRVRGRELFVELKDDPPVGHHKPSVDFLFKSLAEQIPQRTIAVLLTGMGTDGANGMLALKNAGAHTVAQDEQTSVVFGMPGEAIRLGAAEKVAPLGSIPEVVLGWLRKSS